MPYSFPGNVPAFAKEQSETFQKEFVRRFNDCYSNISKAGHKGDDLDNRARICAWSRMKADGWRKGTNDKWTKKDIVPMYLTIKIAKVDEKTRRVYGYATTEDIDFENEVVDKVAIEKAILDFAERATMREMHQKWAVGKFDVLEVDEKGLWVSGQVIDDAAWKKVVAGVYRWFSIGFKRLEETVEKGVNHVKSLLLFEISVVDVGCNLGARMGFATKSAGDKAVWWDDTREEVKMEGDEKTWVMTQEMIKELPDDSFALVNKTGRFIPHHDKEGKVYAEACVNGVDVLNGAKAAVGGPNIMEKISTEERSDMYKHLKTHLKELKVSIPPLETLTEKSVESEKSGTEATPVDVAKTFGRQLIDAGKALLGISPDTANKQKKPDTDFDANFEVEQARGSLWTVFFTLERTINKILGKTDMEPADMIKLVTAAFDSAKEIWIDLFKTITASFKTVEHLVKNSEKDATGEDAPTIKTKFLELLDCKVGAKLSKTRLAALKNVVTALNEIIAEATETTGEKITKGGNTMEIKQEAGKDGLVNVTVIGEDKIEKKFIYNTKTSEMAPADKPADAPKTEPAKITEATEKALGDVTNSLKTITENVTALSKKLGESSKAIDTSIATAVKKSEDAITEKMNGLANRLAVIEKIEGKSVQADGNGEGKPKPGSNPFWMNKKNADKPA